MNIVVNQISAIVPYLKFYKVYSTFMDLKSEMTLERTAALVSNLEGVSKNEVEKITDILLRADEIEAEADSKLPNFIRDWKKAYVEANGKAAPHVELYSSKGGWYTVQGNKRRKKDFLEMTEVLRKRIG